MRINKYGNKKTKVDGHTFDSKAEARRYGELKLMQRAGLIKHLKLQPRYRIQDGFSNGEGKRVRPISYVADFEYIDLQKNDVVIEDVKGKKTQVYNLKKKIFEKKYHPRVITEITYRN